MKYMRWTVVFLAVCVLASARPGFGQGVTTGSLAGLVTDNQQRPVVGASVLAIHEPSGTTYEGTTRADGLPSGPTDATVMALGSPGMTRFASSKRAAKR